MNRFWFKGDSFGFGSPGNLSTVLTAKSLSPNPGKNCFFVLFKNCFKNKTLRFSIVSPERWSDASEVVNTNSSGFPNCP